MISLLLALLITFAIPSVEFGKEFDPYVNEFLSIVEEHCKFEQVSMPSRKEIRFVESFPGQGYAALCSYNRVFWRIEILRDSWDNYSYQQRTEMMFHELSHCILRLDHVDNPYNYMYYKMTDKGLSTLDIRKQLAVDAEKKCR